MVGDPLCRSDAEFAHRCQCAWMKFHKHRDVLTDKNISIRSRLKLFDSTITPTLLYRLLQIPLLQHQCSKLDSLQRRMLRQVVGWVSMPNEPWDLTMSRMKRRVGSALHQFPIDMWTMQLSRRQFCIGMHLTRHKNQWPYICAAWSPASTYPNANRSRGHPRVRWDKNLAAFSTSRYGEAAWYSLFDPDAHPPAIEEYLNFVHA